jgi:hypothetical protein
MANGDYQWITRTGSDMLYVSTPSSIDGNMHAINDNRPIALDLAYVGSTSLHTISNRNVERAFFSLSKPFGVRNIRTGWYFTKQLDQKLEDLVGSAKYYNYYASDVAEAIIENFAIDYVYNKLHNQQRTYCELLDLTPSDSVWLGTGTQEEYAKFRRQGNIARVCLAGLYEHES